MKDEKKVIVFFLCSMIVILMLSIGVCFYFSGYKNGQIDAFTGKIEYRLVINPDSTREWKGIKE